MWSYQHLDPNVVSPTLSDAEEAANMSSYTSSPPMSPLIGFAEGHPETESESEEEELEPPATLAASATTCTSVDILVLKSIDTYVLSVRPPEEHFTEGEGPQMTPVLWPHGHRTLLPSLSRGHSSPASGTEEDVDSPSDDDSLSEDTDLINACTTPRASILRSNAALNIPLPTKRSPPPVPEPLRRQLRSIQSMPQPNLLAKQVANRVIKYARCLRSIHEEEMCCLNCGLFPVYPVTGKCGHTRCTNCVKMMTTCPCGKEAPQTLYVNIVIRDLLCKAAASRNVRAQKGASTSNPKRAVPANKILTDAGGSSVGPIRGSRGKRRSLSAVTGPYLQHVPMTARSRLAHALNLLQSGRHMDAAPHLALAAASYHSDMRVARTLLAQVIMILSNNADPRCLTRELYQFVRQLTSMTWVKTDDMECILCCDIYIKPVTTPCGHMFCKTCLEKTLDYRKRCPLCLRGMGDFKLSEANETLFVKGALSAINALNIPKPMEEENLVPIFVCTVAFPTVPCPLFIFDPRYWLMIRRVLESGSRRFGMVAMDRDKKYADYGTILEVRDCVHLEDGRSILSTIGLSRFKVIERSVRDGCEVARIQPIHDIPPDDGMATDDLKMYASQIMLKALFWLSQLGSKVLSDIENAFGSLPSLREEEEHEEWWESTDGPSWLWWLVAVLPLRTEIKGADDLKNFDLWVVIRNVLKVGVTYVTFWGYFEVLILSTDCLIKRMMAVVRTLEAVARVTLTTMSPGQCEVQVTMPDDTLMG